MKELEFIKNLEILNIKKDDVLIVRVNYPIAAEVAMAIEKSISEKLSGSVKIIVIDSNADIGVLRAEK